MKYAFIIAVAGAYTQYDDCSTDATICSGDLCCGKAKPDAEFQDCTSCASKNGAADTPVENQADKERTICADRRQWKVIEQINTALTTSVDGRPAKYVAANYKAGHANNQLAAYTFQCNTVLTASAQALFATVSSLFAMTSINF